MPVFEEPGNVTKRKEVPAFQKGLWFCGVNWLLRMLKERPLPPGSSPLSQLSGFVIIGIWSKWLFSVSPTCTTSRLLSPFLLRCQSYPPLGTTKNVPELPFVPRGDASLRLERLSINKTTYLKAVSFRKHPSWDCTGFFTPWPSPERQPSVWQPPFCFPWTRSISGPQWVPKMFCKPTHKCLMEKYIIIKSTLEMMEEAFLVVTAAAVRFRLRSHFDTETDIRNQVLCDTAGARAFRVHNTTVQGLDLLWRVIN